MKWPDLAQWVGPTVNRTANAMVYPPRGLVIHIASGFYEGTIAWQDNPNADVSSHFIIGRQGECAQMVDTTDASWAQKSGNTTWLSAEFEGFGVEDSLHSQHPGWEYLTPGQIDCAARLLLRGRSVYGWPLQVATSPSGRGLGHHSMGAESGVDWGHSLCPGEAIKSQKQSIIDRALVLLAGPPAARKDDGLPLAVQRLFL